MLNNVKRKIKYSGILLVFTVFLLFVACEKDMPGPSLSENNQWILDSMRVYYYWNEQLPRHPVDQQTPSSFFNSLLNPADRFSFIINPSESKTEYSSFAWYGFEYRMLELAGKVAAVVTLVVPGSPADQAGLKRGDFFISVNDVHFNTSTMKDTERLLRLGNGIRLGLATLSAGNWEQAATVTINTSRFTEQPVYLVKTLEGNGKKAGYIFYNQFAGSYDYRILEAIGSFKSQGISNLILDLRYNPGGDVSSATKIAAVLSGCRADDAFVVYQANKNGGRRTSTFQQTMNETSYGPQSFSDLLGYRAGVDRVIILATGATASAAELLAIALRPYTNVVLIGAPTMGKDMASFAIEDHRQPKQTNIVLHPLVFKLYNAQGEGDYASGLRPDYAIDEFSLLPLRPFGDTEDPLLKKALELSGMSFSSGPIIKMQSGNLPDVRHSVLQSTVRSPLPMVIKKFR